VLVGCKESLDKFMPHINGKYLGQDPAFNTPEVFAPGIISNAFDERMLFFF
jgi:hypothetical protein